MRESLARSNRDLWFRMYEVVSHFAKRLGDPDARLYASVFMKVAEMAEILPKLNITNDPALNVLAEQVKTQLCQFSVSSLRDNDRSVRNRGQSRHSGAANGYHARRIVPLQRNRKIRGAR